MFEEDMDWELRRLYPFVDSWSTRRSDGGMTETQQAVIDGIRLGRILGKKLQDMPSRLSQLFVDEFPIMKLSAIKLMCERRVRLRICYRIEICLRNPPTLLRRKSAAIALRMRAKGCLRILFLLLCFVGTRLR